MWDVKFLRFNKNGLESKGFTLTMWDVKVFVNEEFANEWIVLP